MMKLARTTILGAIALASVIFASPASAATVEPGSAQSGDSAATVEPGSAQSGDIVLSYGFRSSRGYYTIGVDGKWEWWTIWAMDQGTLSASVNAQLHKLVNSAELLGEVKQPQPESCPNETGYSLKAEGVEFPHSCGMSNPRTPVFNEVVKIIQGATSRGDSVKFNQAFSSVRWSRQEAERSAQKEMEEAVTQGRFSSCTQVGAPYTHWLPEPGGWHVYAESAVYALCS
jgi:hypothetical protein